MSNIKNPEPNWKLSAKERKIIYERQQELVRRKEYKHMNIIFHKNQKHIFDWIERVAKKEGRSRSKQVIIMLEMLMNNNKGRKGYE